MTVGSSPNVQTAATGHVSRVVDPDASLRRSSRTTSRQRPGVLAEPRWTPTRRKPTPFVEREAGCVLGQDARPGASRARPPRTPGSAPRAAPGRRRGRGPRPRRRRSPRRRRRRPSAPSSRPARSSRGPAPPASIARDEPAVRAVGTVEVVPVRRLALERGVAGGDALGVDPPDRRPVGRRHRLDPERRTLPRRHHRCRRGLSRGAPRSASRSAPRRSIRRTTSSPGSR